MLAPARATICQFCARARRACTGVFCGRGLRPAAAAHGCVWEPERVRVRERCSHSHASAPGALTCWDRPFHSASTPTERWGWEDTFHRLFPDPCPWKYPLTIHPFLAPRAGQEANQHGCCALKLRCWWCSEIMLLGSNPQFNPSRTQLTARYDSCQIEI